jgi:hypothetical protein
MTLVEPMTMITDYLLGVVCLALGVSLLRWQRKMAAVAFFFIAAAAFTGGAHHGLGGALSEAAIVALWRISLVSAGLSTFFLIVAVVYVTMPERRLMWVSIAAAHLAAYLAWIATDDSFRAAEYDYHSGMAAILGFCAAGARRGQRAFGRWMAAGVLVSLSASAAQAGGLDLAANFNHNDLYHVVEIGAVLLFHRAFVRSRDK